MINKKSILRLFFIAVVVFNLVFPKGGIKVNDIPITIGLVSLTILLIVGGVSSVVKYKIYIINYKRLKILLSWLPFQIWMILTINENGFSSLGMVFSLIYNFLILPWMLMFLNGENFDKNVNTVRFFNIIKYGIWFLVIYGLVNHGYKIIYDSYIEIPFLTVNYDDVGGIYNKDNGRGIFGKLVSTYQNGNILGVSMLMLLPLFCYLDKKTWHQVVLKITLFLTLSRTIWLGLLFYELCNGFGARINVKKVMLMLLMILLMCLGVVYAIDLLGLDSSFLLDSSLGGRIDTSRSAVYSFIPTAEFSGIAEIVYKGIIEGFGIIGLLFFLVGFFSPLYVCYKKNMKRDTLEYNLLLGLVVYYFVCLGDGAILLIPVMLFYWVIVLLLTSPCINEK